ncbi:cytochrome P450 6k1-like [Ischnura elegans]|uniref:cytochrome P450 6k1-like n=1 Tax=Ischnura elegans TaxID=197161 RepID=UPI001ED89EAA|nr:cytochrome P450 6k1-like [Ischnura elegans]
MGSQGENLRRPEVIVPLLFILVGVFWWLVVKPLSYWKKRGVPSIPAAPLTGSMPLLFWRKYIGDVFASMYAKLEGKKYGGFHNLSKPSILIRDLDIIKDILETNSNNFHDNDFELPATTGEEYGQNLSFLTDGSWNALKPNLTEIYSAGNIKNAMPFILEVCETLEDCVSTKIEMAMELKEMGECYTTDVISSIVFGTRGDSLLNPCGKFRRMGCKIAGMSASRSLAMKIPLLLKIIPCLCSSRKAVDYFRSVVKEAVHIREEEKVQRPDFLHVLLELQKQGKLKVSEEQTSDPSKTDSEGNTTELDNEALNTIATQALTFFINGYYATSNLISFSLFELAYNGDIQSRARAEVTKALEHHGSMSQDALSQLHYLDLILKETIRKYPPSPFLARKASKKYYLPSAEYENEEEKSKEGIWLEEGSSVVVPVLGIHQDPKYYPNPETYNPDNFSEKTASQRNSYTFLGFGKGSRACNSMQLSLLLAKVAIASLLAKYDFSPCEKTSLPITMDPSYLITMAQGGLWVKVSSLKKKY